MNRSASALAISAVIALGALTACGSSAGNTVTPASQAAPAGTAAAAETPLAKTSGAFGDTITFPSGVAVKVSVPTAVPAPQYSVGGVEGKIVTFDISVTNGSKEQINGAIMGYPKVTYGAAGTPAQNATDVASGIGGAYLSTILPGETQTVKVGYGIPAAGFPDVRMEVTGPTFQEKAAIFKGAVS